MINPRIDIEITNSIHGEIQCSINIEFFTDDCISDPLRTELLKLIVQKTYEEEIFNCISTAFLYSHVSRITSDAIKFKIIERIYNLCGEDFQKLHDMPDFMIQQEIDKIKVMEELVR